MPRLEVDPSLIESSLRIKEINDEEDAFNKMFESEESKKLGFDDGIPWIRVVPSPGICVKFFTPDRDKVFINVCHTPELPLPPDISEEELIKILESIDPSTYRIPMSIADEHKEQDKSGVLCSVYDIAVHSTLLEKIINSPLFQVFFMTVVAEGIQEKYNVKLDMSSRNPFIVLKNRKAFGNLRAHRIQKRDVRPAPKPIIQEVVSSTNHSQLEVKADPKLRLELHPAKGDPEYLIVRVKIKAFSERDIHLDVGEDRLVLTSTKKQQAFVDIFLPYNVNQSETTAEYSRLKQELKIQMPILK